MSQTSLLEKLYAEMSNEQLIYKVGNEKKELSAEVIAIAKKEFLKRNIDINKIELAKKQEVQAQKNYEQFLSGKTNEESLALFGNIITDKINGKDNSSIISEFEKQGISTEIASLLIVDAKRKCQDGIYKTRGDILYGSLITIIAIGTAIVLYKESNGRTIFVAYGAVLSGLFKFLIINRYQLY